MQRDIPATLPMRDTRRLELVADIQEWLLPPKLPVEQPVYKELLRAVRELIERLRVYAQEEERVQLLRVVVVEAEQRIVCLLRYRVLQPRPQLRFLLKAPKAATQQVARYIPNTRSSIGYQQTSGTGPIYYQTSPSTLSSASDD